MPVHNSDIAEAFRRLADLLEIEGGNEFRVRAYRNAAATVEGLPHDAARMLDEGEDLSELPGIGEDLAGKIETLIETGELPLLKELEARVPEGLAEITHVAGIGPKRAWKLYEVLDIETIDALRKAAEAGEVREIEGFGEKTEANIIDALGRFEGGEKRLRLMDAEHIAEPMIAYIREIEGVKQAVIAGSYRRQKETVGDLDILVTAKRGSDVMDRFVEYDEVDEVVSKGDTRSTVILQSGFHVDLRVVAEVSYGAALFYFTGSKAHNIAVRKRAIDRGWKLNEYGLFEDDERIAGKTEEEVYEKVDLTFIPPLLRENRGEIAAAESGQLPELVKLDDIRGDLHCHTKWSDGKFTVREMAEAAKKKGYTFLGITDHSKSQTVAGGLSEDELAKQIDEIDELNEELDGIRLLKGSEVDILENGKLDFSDNILARLDYVICAIHGGFGLSREKQTERVLRAMDNKHFNILAHATGRLINERAPYDIDLDRIMTGAEDRGCFLELNAHPNRLDINDARCKMARDVGLMVPIGTDAHSINGLETMRFGIAQAGRGWLAAGDVLNTREPDELLKLLRR
jgi:DNA polymerase (family 10)